MSTSVRARQGARGFSFVELLVTIVIAGIAFAAIVPLFVSAQSKNSADNMRNISTQLAQDKLEKIRQLAYEEISTAALESTATAGGQFGKTWDYHSGQGSAKQFSITYTVATVPSGLPAGQEHFKQITVEVKWQAPPKPVYPVIMSTRIYKQYAGPQIIQFEVGPSTVFTEQPPDVFTITGAPVIVDAYINPNDILAMDAANPDPAQRGWVKFTVSAYSGTTVAEQAVDGEYNNEPGHYQFTWYNSSAPDGIYKIEATGFSKTKLQGNTVSFGYNVNRGVPPAPTGLTATAGDGVVTVNWATTTIGDFHHYVLERREGLAGVWTILAPSLLTATYIDGPPTSAPPPPPQNGTTYYYRVHVVDIDNNASSPSTVADATPQAQPDSISPSVPLDFSATKVLGARSVNLAWSSSSDSGTPASGMKGYIIQRSDNAAFPTYSELESGYPYPNVAFTDPNAGWGSTWYYRIAAVDNAGNASGWAFSLVVTTDPQPTHSLTVNASNKNINVWVQGVVTGLWYATNGTALLNKPAAVPVDSGGSKSWTGLPADLYNVFVTHRPSGTQLTPKSGSSDLSVGDNSISF